MNSPPTPRPPGDNRGFRLPLLINAGLFGLLALLSFSVGDNRLEALYMLAFLLLGLGGLNAVALLIVALTGKSQWVAGLALSVGLLFLVGLGTCGLMLT